MQMYVNYYTRELMNEGDNPPIGIVLCADKSDSIVEYTLPEDNDQVFAAKYLPYLPSKEELARELSASTAPSTKRLMAKRKGSSTLRPIPPTAFHIPRHKRSAP